MFGCDTLMLRHVSAATIASDGPEMPGIDDFLLPEILFEGTPFAMNRIIFVRLVATALMLLFLGVVAKRAKVVPGRCQGLVELLLDFVRDSIVYEVMGEMRGKRYVPMITTMFMTIFVFNLCGIIPGLNIAATSSIAMPLMFALWTFFQTWRAAISTQGIGKYLKHELCPPGVPPAAAILIAPLQFLDIMVVHPLSLTIRLFANMVAGHLIVALCFTATEYFLVETFSAMTAAGVLTLAGGIVMTLFEAFVAGLQAFIFSTLSVVYINAAYPDFD